ncbi:putative gag-pol protein [Trichonephila clavipes]|nr:putative gag-pol protein [Trichonephila clavipes]
MVDASDYTVDGVLQQYVNNHWQPLAFFSMRLTLTQKSKRFDELNLHIIGPLPAASGYRHCVTIVDRFTRWPEALPVMDIRAETIATAVYRGWISKFGSPSYIVTDQGTQFESELFYELFKLLGFKRKRITAYNPPANGLVWRWHRTLKAAIMCHSDATWYQSLPTVLFGLRTTIKEDLKATSAELVFGENLRLPDDFLCDSKLASPSSFVQQLRNTFADSRPVLPSHHTKQKPFIFPDLATCTHVFVRTDSVRTSLQLPYEEPYPVIKTYAKYIDISIRGVSGTISIDRLKPCFFADPDPAKPTSADISSTTSTSSTVSAGPHHSQQGTSQQSSKLPMRFAEPPAQYVTLYGRAVLPSR